MFAQLDTALSFHFASFLSVPEQIQLRKISKAFNHEITTERVLYITHSERYSLPEFHAVMDQYAKEDSVLLNRVTHCFPEHFYQQIVTKVFSRKITSSLRNQINLEIFFLLHVQRSGTISNGRVHVVNQLMLRHSGNSEEKSSLQAMDSLPEFSDLLLQFTGWVDRKYRSSENPQQQSLVFLQNLRSDLCYRAKKFNSFVQEALLHQAPTVYFPPMYIVLLLYRAEEITSLLQKEKISLSQFFLFEPSFISLLIHHVEAVASLVEGTKLSLQQLRDTSVEIRSFLLRYTKEVICLTKETAISPQELLDLSGKLFFTKAERFFEYLSCYKENFVYLVKERGVSLQQLQSFSEDFARWLLSNPKLKISFTYLFREVLFLFLVILFAVPCLIIPGYRCLIEDQAKDVGYACYYQFFIRKIPMSDQVNHEVVISTPA